MANDDINKAKLAHEMRTRGKDFAVVTLPGFSEWAQRQSGSGGNEAAIDHMLAMSMFLLPEEVALVTDADFDEIYQDLVEELR